MSRELNAGRSVPVAPSEVREGAGNARAFPLRKGMENLPEIPMQPVYIDHNPEVPRPAPSASDGNSRRPTPAPVTQPPAVSSDD